MFCFCESNEKRLKSARSKFADASISRWIEDWGRERPRHCSVICQSIFKTKISLERSFPALNQHVLFFESNEKRLHSVRSKFADESISRLIEEWGSSEVQPTYRLAKVRETCAAFERLTWRKYETNCRSWKRLFLIFNVVKRREISSFACVV